MHWKGLLGACAPAGCYCIGAFAAQGPVHTSAPSLLTTPYIPWTRCPLQGGRCRDARVPPAGPRPRQLPLLYVRLDMTHCLAVAAAYYRTAKGMLHVYRQSYLPNLHSMPTPGPMARLFPQGGVAIPRVVLTKKPPTPQRPRYSPLLTSHGSYYPQGGVALQVSRPLGPSPDGYQGWGRLSLRGTLPLRGYTHPDFALQLLDGGAFDRNNTEVVVGGVTATGTGCVGCRGCVLTHV